MPFAYAPGRYADALPFAERNAVENPSNCFAQINLTDVLGFLGQFEAALQVWAEVRALVPKLTVGLFHRGHHELRTDKSVAGGFVNGLIAVGIE